MHDSDNDFEKFRGGPTQSPKGRVYVSINKERVIGLNRNCYNLLGQPPAVFLHFSRKGHTIAIEPLQSARVPDAFPVKPKTSVGWRINALPFCRFFGIRIETTERFVEPQITEKGLLLLDLSNTITIRQQRHKRKPQGSV